MPTKLPVSGPQRLNRFRTWIRPMGCAWKVRVEGKENAEWLVQQLADAGFRSTVPQDIQGNGHFSFTCLTETRADKNSVERLLTRWPEVQIQLSPDDAVRPSTPLFSSHVDSAMDKTVQPQAADVSPFRVWARPMGMAWKIRAEGLSGATWLYNELLHRGLDCTEPFDASGTGTYVFRCMSVSAVQKDYVWRLLRQLPHVLLQNDPA